MNTQTNQYQYIQRSPTHSSVRTGWITFTTGIVLSITGIGLILIPISFICGIIATAKDNVGHGVALMFSNIVFAVFFIVFLLLFGLASSAGAV